MKRNGLVSIIGIIALAVLLLAGCSASATVQDGTPITEVYEPAATTPQPTKPPATEPAAPETVPPTAALLTAEAAESIALEHAGLTADQVTRLTSKYEIDDGIPEYDVEFYVGTTEYDYEIHAETGDILSWDKDVNG